MKRTPIVTLSEAKAKGSRGELEAPFAEFPSRVAKLPGNATGSLDCAQDDISV